jgi:hypothetical protein
MKPIGDLGGRWRPLYGTSGIILGPVAGDDGDPWMGAQPRRDGLGGALREEFHGPTSFEIHQDGPINPTLAEGKIIDPEDPGRRPCGPRGGTENPQDGIATERHAQAAGHARPGFAPASPPSTRMVVVKRTVRCAWTGASAGRRSAKVRRGHVGVRQRKRRTCKRRRTGCSTTGRSRSWRV